MKRAAPRPWLWPVAALAVLAALAAALWHWRPRPAVPSPPPNAASITDAAVCAEYYAHTNRRGQPCDELVQIARPHELPGLVLVCESRIDLAGCSGMAALVGAHYYDHVVDALPEVLRANDWAHQSLAQRTTIGRVIVTLAFDAGEPVTDPTTCNAEEQTHYQPASVTNATDGTFRLDGYYQQAVSYFDPHPPCQHLVLIVHPDATVESVSPPVVYPPGH